MTYLRQGCACIMLKHQMVGCVNEWGRVKAINPLSNTKSYKSPTKGRVGYKMVILACIAIRNSWQLFLWSASWFVMMTIPWRFKTGWSGRLQTSSENFGGWLQPDYHLSTRNSSSRHRNLSLTWTTYVLLLLFAKNQPIFTAKLIPPFLWYLDSYSACRWSHMSGVIWPPGLLWASVDSPCICIM